MLSLLLRLLPEISSIISSLKDLLDSWRDSLISSRMDSLILLEDEAKDYLMDYRMDYLITLLDSPAID